MFRSLIGVGLQSAVVSICAAQSCQPYWVNPTPFDVGLYSAVVAFDDGSGERLYGIGQPNGSTPPYVYGAFRWDGHGWQSISKSLPQPFGGFQGGLLVLDDGSGPCLYGLAAHQKGQPLGGDNLKWNGNRWVPCPPGLCSIGLLPYAVPQCSFDDGTGSTIYGIADIGEDRCIARWTGAQWQSLGSVAFAGNSHLGLRSVTLRDGPALLAVGGFTSIGGVPARNAAVWKDHAWRQLGEGIYNVYSFRDFEVFDSGSGPDLYVAGDVSLQDGNHQTLIRWDGQTWSPVVGAPVTWCLKTFNDGSGSALYATGSFASAGGVEAHNIAKFDGNNWHPLGAGSGPNSRTMTVYNDPRGPSLFVIMGGGFTPPTGGGIVAGFAQWVGCPSCYANCDNSTTPPILNANDFVCFLNRYAVRDPYANCGVDATITIADFSCFLNKFAAGCH